ncbi:MAG: hypothetical protein U9N05_00645 [Euryarchaeota archaeon]|nr:hypothetical protein [Euryarchaeota archaeon]
MHIVNIEEIQGTLLHVPELIDSLENRDPNFAVLVKDWLTEAEQVLINNRLAVASDVAVLRGVLISAERGVLPDGMVLTGRKTARKIRDAAAADALRRASELISDAIRGDAAQIAEGEKLTRQLVALAERKGIVPDDPDTRGHSETLNTIWRAMSEDPELGPATTHLAGLVGAYDALVLLDRMLPVP